jgi:hypothetical protein
MPPPPPAGHPPLEDQNAVSSLRHGSSQDSHQWLVAYSCSESDASQQKRVPYWYNPFSCNHDGLPDRSWVFPQPPNSNQSLASSVTFRQVRQEHPLDSGVGGGRMVSETQSQAIAGPILKKTQSVLHAVFEDAFPRTTGV